MSIYPPVRDNMVRLLSTPRLDTYTKECGGSVAAALELYRWNLDASMAFFEVIHYFEVAFRNTVDSAMQKWFQNTQPLLATGDTSWFSTEVKPDSGSPGPAELCNLNSTSRRIVGNATREAGKRHTPIEHGHVVAELTLGFWQHVVATPGKNADPTTQTKAQTIWAQALKPAFKPSVKQQRLADTVEQVRDLRNRIAYHEPIFGLNLEAEYNNIIGVAEVTSTGLGWWIDTVSRVGDTLSTRPSRSRHALMRPPLTIARPPTRIPGTTGRPGPPAPPPA